MLLQLFSSMRPSREKSAVQISLGGGLVAALAIKTLVEIWRTWHVAKLVWARDSRLPLKKQPSRKEREESLKRGPRALGEFLKEDSRPDVIVIGSGIGGLTCAALLGRAGKRVLVLEGHDLAGGCLHTYSAGGYEWDVGIHYVGEVGGPGVHQAILEQLSRGQLQWSRQDDPYDVAYVPASQEDGRNNKWQAFPQRQGIDVNKASLCKCFPSEEAGIQLFYRDVQRQSAGALFLLPKILPRLLARLVCPLIDFCTGFYTRLSTPLATALDTLRIENNQARAVLAYPWGDLGNMPASIPYGIMLGLHGHFAKDGGFFPVGGAGAISYALVETIRTQSGDVLVRCPVKKILTQKNKAYGVMLDSGKEVLLAPGGHVVSAVSLRTLYCSLLDSTQVPRAPSSVMSDTGCLREGIAAMSLFVGLENSGSELGLDSIQENAWAYRGPCFDKDFPKYLAQSPEDVIAGVLPWPGIFVGFPSSKDPAWNEDFPGKSSVTIISFVNWEWFAPYQGSRVHKRGPEYDKLKDAIAKQMWSFACDVYPQLKQAKIGHFEAGSPLSNNYYIGSRKGEIYGADHNYERFSLRNFIDARPDMTGVENLVLAGQDVFCGGFAGALFGGVLAAGTALGSWAGMWLGMLYSGFRYVPRFTL